MSDKKNILILTIVFIIISIIFYGKTGNMLIDFSREAYIPYQMLNGKLLIKDIFLIYGAFGYIINLIIYKVFSTNINLIIAEALLISYSCTILLYFIFKKYTQEKLSLTFCIFFILSSVFSHSTFGLALPYSYSTLWAIFAIILSLFLLLYDKKNILFLSLGLIISNKIELFFPTLILSLVYLISYKKSFIKNIWTIFIFPIITTGYLLLSEITLDDVIKNYIFIKEMVQSDSLKYLYQGMGGYFETQYFIHNIIELAKFLSISIISYFIYKYKPFLSYLFFIIAIGFLNTNQSLNLLGIILLILIIVLYKYKKITKEEMLIATFGLILSSKAIFATSSISYSNFGYITLLFSTYILLEKIINKNWLKIITITFLTMNFTLNLSHIIIDSKEKIKTQVGTIWIDKLGKELFEEINNYLKVNLKKEDDFIVLPEGQLFNLIHNKPHEFYNSTFTPLDFETFKEDNLIKKLKENSPEYIIFLPRNTLDYGKNMICSNYGVDFCTYIMDNYTKEKTFGENYRANIFKRK